MKITVIGGGLGGLTTSAYLAKQGHHVTLIEKNKKLGGRARILKTKEGFTFDMGPSWYMMPEVIEQIFNELGYNPSDFFTLKELETKYRVFKDGQKPIDVVSDLQTNLERFSKIDKNDLTGIKTLLNKTKKSYDLSINKFLQKPYHTVFDFLHLSDIINGIQLITNFNLFQSYHHFIQKYITNKTLQQIFEFHTVFLGGSPYSTPALYSILITADFYKKIWYPIGGMGELVKALEKICVDNKVKIITGKSVENLIVDEKNHTISDVIVDQKKISTDLVVSGADYAYTQLNLLPKKYQEYDKKYWETRNYSISTILVYIGLNKKMKKVSHHNFYFQDNWENHFDTIQKTSYFPEKPNFYLSVATVTDETIAPKNCDSLFILVPVSTKTTTTNVDLYITKIFNHVENKIGEKFQNNIIYKKIYTQKDFTHDYNAYKGNALGLAHDLKQSVFLRPRMKAKKLTNLYYVGQFTQPGVGVPTVMLSGKYCADLIRNELHE